MSMERMQILKMVAEGKISPEDGDRLLARLAEVAGDAGGRGEQPAPARGVFCE